MKNCLLIIILISCFFVTSCSKDDDVNNKEIEEQEDIEYTFVIQNATKKNFEWVSFTYTDKENEGESSIYSKSTKVISPEEQTLFDNGLKINEISSEIKTKNKYIQATFVYKIGAGYFDTYMCRFPFESPGSKVYYKLEPNRLNFLKIERIH